MIELIARLIDWISDNFFINNDEEIEYLEAIRLEYVYYETPSIMHMKRYKNPHIGQKFYCQYENEMYVYVGGKKFVYMTNVYI